MELCPICSGTVLFIVEDTRGELRYCPNCHKMMDARLCREVSDKIQCEFSI